MKQHQGKCPTCRIIWTWAGQTPIKRQNCAACRGSLLRLHPWDRAGLDRVTDRPYTWMSWEGYR